MMINRLVKLGSGSSSKESNNENNIIDNMDFVNTRELHIAEIEQQLQNWSIPKVPAKQIYETGFKFSELFSQDYIINLAPNYVADFIPNIRIICAPLFKRLKKEKEPWNQEMTDTVKTIKGLVKNLPCLGIPKQGAKLIVETDASGFFLFLLGLLLSITGSVLK